MSALADVGLHIGVGLSLCNRLASMVEVLIEKVSVADRP